MNPETNALAGVLFETEALNWHLDLNGVTYSDSLQIKKAFSTLPKTETIAAEFISKRLAGYLSYNALTDTWFLWDQRVHKPCVGSSIVKKLIREFYKAHSKAINALEEHIWNENNVPDEKERDKHVAKLAKYKYFRDFMSKDAGKSAITRELETLLDIAVDHFDDDTRWFVVENGVYDMHDVRETRNFKLLPHDRFRPVYRMFNLAEEVGASHSAITGFTNESIEDKGQARFFQKIVGTALMGITTDTRSVVSIQGAPNSGKSMILRVLNTFARDYVATPSKEAIVKNGRNPYHARYKMRAARVAGFTEVTDQLTRDFLLQYSGGDEYEVEEKYVAGGQVQPQGIIFMFSNHGVNIDKTDKATYDRLKPINFPFTFEAASLDGHELDTGLQAAIEEQQAGFLEWIKAGYLMGLEEGFDCTDSMEALKRSERDAEEDDVAAYLSDRMELGTLFESDNPDHWCKLKDLHADYVTWWTSGLGSQKKEGRNTFGLKVAKKYVKGGNNDRYFVGLGLKDYVLR